MQISQEMARPVSADIEELRAMVAQLEIELASLKVRPARSIPNTLHVLLTSR